MCIVIWASGFRREKTKQTKQTKQQKTTERATEKTT